MNRSVTINDIKESLCEVDSVYREALARCLVDLKYLSDTPLKLSIGGVKEQLELEKVTSKPLKENQIREIFDYISNSFGKER